MTTCSMLVDVITKATSIFDITKSMQRHQLNDDEYKHSFMLCFSRYPELERQKCVIRCARWMRYMPLVEAMLSRQPLTKKQWLQFAYNLLTSEESRMDSDNIIARRVLDRVFFEKQVSPEDVLSKPIARMRNRLLYTFIALHETGQYVSIPAVDSVSVPKDGSYADILLELAKPFMAQIVHRMFRDLHGAKSCVPHQLLDFIDSAFPGYLYTFKHGHIAVAGFIGVTKADLYVKYMHCFSSDIPDAEPGEVEFIVWQCLWTSQYKIAKWLLEHMKTDREKIMANVTPDSNWQLELIGFDTGMPIKGEPSPSLATSSEIYKCIHTKLAAAASVRRLPALLLQGHRLHPSESSEVFTAPGFCELHEVRVFALNNAIQTTFVNLIPERICVSAWALVCQYVGPDISVLMCY